MDAIQSSEFRHPLARIERRPVTCTWEITRRCNLACVHCENWGGSKSARELDLTELVHVADELVRLGCRHVNLTGGEPLLHPGWDGLARHLAALGATTTLITNATLLDAPMLARVVDAGVSALGLSIDGMPATHDATRVRRTPGPSPWSETAAALRLAVTRLPCTVITQVNRHNLRELPELWAWLRDAGVSRWQIQLAIPVGRVLDLAEPYVLAPADLPELAASIESFEAHGAPPQILVSDTIGYYTCHEMALRGRRGAIWVGCQAGIRLLAITCDGKVRGCSSLPPEFDAGDLHDESLGAIWNDAHRFAYTTEFDAKRLTGGCARCQFGPLCRAGCPSLAYWTTGTIHENPYCLQRLESA